MIAAQRATGKLLAINWPIRWFPCYIAAKRIIDSGVIGDVLGFHHYGGNRNGGGSVDRHYKGGHAGKNRFRLQGYFPHHVYRRSGVDAFRTSQINGIPGI